MTASSLSQRDHPLPGEFVAAPGPRRAALLLAAGGMVLVTAYALVRVRLGLFKDQPAGLPAELLRTGQKPDVAQRLV